MNKGFILIFPAKASGAASQGPYTGEAGYWSYYEICEKINSGGWEHGVDPDMQAAYAYSTSTNEWVGYENLQSMNTRQGLKNTSFLAIVR